MDSEDDEIFLSPNSLRKKRERDRKRAQRATQSTEKAKEIRDRATKLRAVKRSLESDSERAERKTKDAKRTAAARANETEEQTRARQSRNAATTAATRANETEEQTRARVARDAASKAAARANETEEQTRARQSRNAATTAATRANETEEQTRARQSKDAATTAATRGRNHTKVIPKDGLKSAEILDGIYPVPKLEDTEDTIGVMDQECPHCHALKFRGETGSSCCLEGKIDLEPFPLPPETILQLWQSQDRKSTLFRKHCRVINNAVCLSSIIVKERRVGYTPSVIFQGKMQHKLGPLQPADGERPQFAQLYVLDPTLELSERFARMTIPAGMSTADRDLLHELLETVQTELHNCNPFVRDFKQCLEIPDEDIADGQLVISSKQPNGQHPRRYNDQINLDEVRILSNTEPHDLIVHKRGGDLQEVSILNPTGMPLHFTLLFPHGNWGWNQYTQQTTGTRRVSIREFFAYHMNFRVNSVNLNYLFSAGRLFQEWLCFAYTSVEDQRLHYHRTHQSQLRADTYQCVRNSIQQQMAPQQQMADGDGVFNDDHQLQVGRIILASSFTGGARYMNAKFQDAMRICGKFHKPDYFITMTCNPNWPEIQRELQPGQKPQDRPDVVARAFKRRLDKLMKDLTAGGLLGKVVAWMYVIEWQKRGLPHAHILIIMANDDRSLTAEDVDKLISAELPPNPAEVDDPDVKQERKDLQEIVLTNMIHGPCGNANPNSPCMVDGKCSKGFPKPFAKETIMDTDNHYAVYKRRSPEDGGRVMINKNGQIVDNSMVVPYSPYLSKRYNCHINVECCASAKAAKYLFHYITKGNDRAMVATRVEGQPRDEITDYIDLRSCGAGEAAWHLLDFPITNRYPAVHALRVHLPNCQQVYFDGVPSLEILEAQRDTELTAFFKLNATQEGVAVDELPRYVEMPEGHVWDQKKKEWRVRKQKKGEAVIGRVHTINPIAGDVYFLRMLLHDNHCRGKTSFQDLLTLNNGHQCETFKEVCREIGLLEDDTEWERVLEEAAETQMCSQIRSLFVTILKFCTPSNPRALFDQFWSTWTDDYTHRNPNLTEAQLHTLVLLDIEMKLHSFENQLNEFGLPEPSPEELANVQHITSIQPAVIREELDYNIEELTETVEARLPNFTPEQEEIFTKVMESVRNNEQCLVFISASGGCGKTYLLNTILGAVRSSEPGGCTALAMATTGISKLSLNVLHVLNLFIFQELLPICWIWEEHFTQD